jgi:uncharacterized protein YbbC (DUF1343 family)
MMELKVCKNRQKLFFVLFLILLFSSSLFAGGKIKVGAERLDRYLPLLKNKSVGIVANQTTLIGKTNLVDSLLSLKVNLKKILCPEHGFRGDAEAGEIIRDSVDKKSGLPLISIYTASKKPTPKDLQGLDIVIFDLQDVGTRFFTNISHMHYVMEACAENNVVIMVLDRPNPHGFYVDGPLLDTAYRSFVGMHTVPAVHGMTIGEYAMMVNEEGWLRGGIKCNLKVIPCENYTHESLYSLPVKPSPNLPNMTAIYLFPSICFFEGTVVSLGRGTDYPFQMYGHPAFKDLEFSFTPVSKKEAINPPQLNRKCYGYDLRNYDVNKIIKSRKIDLSYIINAYKKYKDIKDTTNFFTAYINTLAGNNKLREQIINGLSEEEIRKTWQPDIENFMKIRKKYLLYKDF